MGNDQGKLIVLDGADGSGKATQTKLLVNRLKQEGIKVKAVDFPRYDKFFGKLINDYLRGKFGSLKNVDPRLACLLYASDRWQASDEIKKWLADGFLVIANRYVSSNAAHQGARVKQDKLDDFLAWLYELEYTIYQVPREDAVIYLDLPVEIGQKLVAGRGKGLDQNESNLAYLKKVARVYQRFSRANKHWRRIDCIQRGKLLSPGQVHEKVYGLINSFLRHN